MSKLFVHHGTGPAIEIDLGGRDRLFIGRAATNDVVMKARMASRAHAVIERTENGYLLRDTDSFNGTFLNNRPVREAPLSDGDQIRIASYLLRFADLSGAASATAARAQAISDKPTSPIPAPRAETGTATDPDEPDTPAEHTPALAPGAAPPAESGAPLAATEGRTAVLSTRDVAALLARGAPRAAGAPDGVASRTAAAAGAAQARETPQRTRPAPATVASAPGARTRPRGQRRLLWLLLAALALVLVAALLVRSRLQSRSQPETPPSSAATAEPDAAGPDRLALQAALALPGDQRAEALWAFVTAWPQSAELEAALLALIEGGADRNLVCDTAARTAPQLIDADRPLHRICQPSQAAPLAPTADR